MQGTHLVLFIGIAILLTLTTTESKRCASYCDIEGKLIRHFDCEDHSWDKYCCGTKTERYCCGNSTNDISDIYEDVENCDDVIINLSHWKFLLGVMGILVLLVVVAACCCQCCTYKNSWNETRVHRERRTRRRDTNISAIELQGTDRAPSFFDPSHPFAFVPPDYESLPKDPPAYSELFGQSGSTNVAFVSETLPEGEQENLQYQASSSHQTLQVEPPPLYHDQNSASTSHVNILQARESPQNTQMNSCAEGLQGVSMGGTVESQAGLEGVESSQESSKVTSHHGVNLSLQNQCFQCSTHSGQCLGHGSGNTDNERVIHQETCDNVIDVDGSGRDTRSHATEAEAAIPEVVNTRSRMARLSRAAREENNITGMSSSLSVLSHGEINV